MAITLRPLADSDLDSLFVWESDPRAVQMAAFTRANPSDRTEFDAHYERIRNDPSCTLRAIDDDTEFVGTMGSFTMEGEREVTYWITPARWGKAWRRGRSVRSLRSSRPGRYTAVWRITMPRQRRCLLGRVSSRWFQNVVRARSRRRDRRAHLPPRPVGGRSKAVAATG